MARTFEGSYDVRGDCAATGSLQVITGTPGLVINFQAIIVANGAEVFFIETDPSTIYTGTLKKIRREEVVRPSPHTPPASLV